MKKIVFIGILLLISAKLVFADLSTSTAPAGAYPKAVPPSSLLSGGTWYMIGNGAIYKSSTTTPAWWWDGGTGNIYTIGTVDGRDISADGTKLDGVVLSTGAAALRLTALEYTTGVLQADLSTEVSNRGIADAAIGVATGTISSLYLAKSSGTVIESAINAKLSISSGTVIESLLAGKLSISSGTVLESAIAGKLPLSSGTVIENAIAAKLNISSGTIFETNDIAFKLFISTAENNIQSKPQDFGIVISTPIYLNTQAIPITILRDYAITITTITIRVYGGTSCKAQIEQRALTAESSAGTIVWVMVLQDCQIKRQVRTLRIILFLQIIVCGFPQ